MDKKLIFKEIDHEPTQEQSDLIDFFCGSYFPLHFSATTSTRHYMFTHMLLRADPNLAPVEGSVNSNFYELSKSLFLDVCHKNNIEVSTILRAAVNNTFHHPDDGCDIHTDHDFNHYNFVYHINDTSAATHIYDFEKKLLVKTIPKKNRAFVFSGFPHKQEWPKPYERRIALIFTFLGRVNEYNT